MRVTGIARTTALALTLSVPLVLSGCGGNPFNPIIDPGGDGRIPTQTPLNDSVLNTMSRFVASYSFQDLPNYSALLTSDFQYTFSAASDPDLVALYSAGWGKDDETESSKHLFEGFTNSDPVPKFVPAATKIDIALNGQQYPDDYTHLDSLAYYKMVVVSTVVMSIEVPQPGTEPITYLISARHEFHLVRGDVAALDPGQEARADRWYIRKWDDLSPPPPTARLAQLASANGKATNSRVGATWGALKSSYLK
jgi:hypothetical protein